MDPLVDSISLLLGVIFQICLYFGDLYSGIAKSSGTFSSDFSKLLHTVFHNGYTDLCFYGQYVRVHFLLTPVRLICILIAFILAGRIRVCILIFLFSTKSVQ